MASYGSFPDHDRLADLRAAIASVPAAGGFASCKIAHFGIPAIDATLPQGGLPLGALHAVLTGDCRDQPASLGFAAGLAGLLAGKGRILWACATGARSGPGDFGALYGPGLVSMGLDPDRIVVVRTRRQDEMLWALEQALTCPDLALAVGEVDPAHALTMTSARRLQLAAAHSGVAALLVGGHAGREDGMVAAVTRWCVAAAPGGLEMGDQVDPAPRFEVGLAARGARPGHWHLRWSPTERRFALAQPHKTVRRADLDAIERGRAFEAAA